MEKFASLLGLLGGATPVTLMANDKLEGTPIVTPLMDESNNPKVDNNDRPLGSIRLEQEVTSLNNGTFLNTRRRVAFVAGVLVDLQARVDTNGWGHGTQFPGKIVITESLAPFYKSQTPKINPASSETVAIKVGDNTFPVYQHMTYSADVETPDTLIRDANDVANWFKNKNEEYEVVAMNNPTPKTQKVNVETATVPV